MISINSVFHLESLQKYHTRHVLFFEILKYYKASLRNTKMRLVIEVHASDFLNCRCKSGCMVRTMKFLVDILIFQQLKLVSFRC
ncbi:hypothetical protein DsansV1_C19g0156361 [Dioscorea sansibarensis]